MREPAGAHGSTLRDGPGLARVKSVCYKDPSWIAAEYERRLVQARNPTAGDLAGIEARIAKLRRENG